MFKTSHQVYPGRLAKEQLSAGPNQHSRTSQRLHHVFCELFGFHCQIFRSLSKFVCQFINFLSPSAHGDGSMVRKKMTSSPKGPFVLILHILVEISCQGLTLGCYWKEVLCIHLCINQSTYLPFCQFAYLSGHLSACIHLPLLGHPSLRSISISIIVLNQTYPSIFISLYLF